MLFLFVIYF